MSWTAKDSVLVSGTGVSLAALLDQLAFIFMTHSDSSKFDESLWVYCGCGLTQNERNNELVDTRLPNNMCTPQQVDRRNVRVQSSKSLRDL